MGTATEYTLRQILYNLSGAGVWEQSGVTQVLVSDIVISSPVTFYTVPAGKVFYLTSLALTGYNNDTARHTGLVKIYDDGDNWQVTWGMHLMPGATLALPVSFPVPVKLLAGWYIEAQSGDSDQLLYLTFTGYTLPE